MTCPNCGAACPDGFTICQGCRVVIPQAAPAPEALPADEGTSPLTVGQCFSAVGIGILPILGLAWCLVTSYGSTPQPILRNLAKALLWVHGIALFLLLAVLGFWLFSLAG